MNKLHFSLLALTVASAAWVTGCGQQDGSGEQLDDALNRVEREAQKAAKELPAPPTTPEKNTVEHQ